MTLQDVFRNTRRPRYWLSSERLAAAAAAVAAEPSSERLTAAAAAAVAEPLLLLLLPLGAPLHLLQSKPNIIDGASLKIPTVRWRRQ